MSMFLGKRVGNLSIFSILFFSQLYSFVASNQQLEDGLLRLQHAYPDHIKAISLDSIIWHDGTSMPLEYSEAKSDSERLNNSTLADQLTQPVYVPGILHESPMTDPGRIRCEPFFRKMYGNDPIEVEKNLTMVSWMPTIFGSQAKLLPVTKIHGIDKKIEQISQELEVLVLQHAEYIPFLCTIGGTYCWRNIANTDRLSCHSFGMTIDINAHMAEYWQWDLRAMQRTISEDEDIIYRNSVPWEIVEVFEKYGFIWGGKWYHYDTMHFEYRPELM